MKEDIKYFLNDYYVLLEALVENEVEGKRGKFVPLSQNDLANETEFSKAKINKLIRKLIADGYVEIIDNGKYSLTKKAKDVYKDLK